MSRNKPSHPFPNKNSFVFKEATLDLLIKHNRKITYSKAMLLLLGLLGWANSTLLASSINTSLTYLQVNSSLLFTSNDL